MKRVGSTETKEHGIGVAMGDEHTRHNWCTFSSCRKLHVVDASSLVGSFLLICPSRCSDICLLLRRPIVLWPRGVLLLRGPIILWSLNILLRGSNYHLLRPRLF